MLTLRWVSRGERQRCGKFKERDRKDIEMMIDGEIMRRRYQQKSLSCSVCCSLVQRAADSH